MPLLPCLLTLLYLLIGVIVLYMTNLGKFLAALWADERAIASVEYALLLAFVGSGIILGAESLSSSVSGTMNLGADVVDNGCSNNGQGVGVPAWCSKNAN